MHHSKRQRWPVADAGFDSSPVLQDNFVWHVCHGLARLGDGESVGETGHGCSKVRLRRVPELYDQRMVFERVLHDAALHACAASVNQPHLAQASFVRGADVLDDNRRDVTRRERVEIDRVFDGDLQLFDSRWLIVVGNW